MGFSFKHQGRASLEELLEEAKSEPTDDTPAMAEILRRFEGLAIKIGRSIKAPPHLRDDLVNTARIGLVNAVRRHDGRPGFPAFAEKYMRGAALREFSSWVVPEVAHGVDLDQLRAAPEHEVKAAEDHLAPWGVGEIADVVEHLSADQQRIVGLRYRFDVPVKEIGAMVGTSGPAVSQRLATIHRIAERALAA